MARRRFAGLLAHSSRATACGRRDQPVLESKGFARRCRRFRKAEQRRCVKVKGRQRSHGGKATAGWLIFRLKLVLLIRSVENS